MVTHLLVMRSTETSCMVQSDPFSHAFLTCDCSSSVDREKKKKSGGFLTRVQLVTFASVGPKPDFFLVL